MKISAGLSTTHDVDIPFGNETLHVMYRPSSVTLADIEQLKANPDPMRLADQIREQVVQWDLESDKTGSIVPLNKPQSPMRVMEQGEELPVESLYDPIKEEVPVAIMLRILIAIQEDQKPDPQR